jgi:hypothetical protein
VSRISTAWNALLGRDVDEKAKPAAPAAPNTAQTEPYRPGMEVGRRGYDTDVPLGGATRMQPGGDYPDGRAAFMRSLYTAYTSCPWLAAPIDAIARTITAGGLVLEPTDQAEDDATPDNPPPSAAGLQNLLDYCNPDQDLVQLLRGGVTDAGIYGDAFVEVVWLLGAPVALFPLDPASMNVEADEHGNVTGYVQVYETLEQPFAPNEVIHVSMDSPKGCPSRRGCSPWPRSRRRCAAATRRTCCSTSRWKSSPRRSPSGAASTRRRTSAPRTSATPSRPGAGSPPPS